MNSFSATRFVLHYTTSLFSNYCSLFVIIRWYGNSKESSQHQYELNRQTTNSVYNLGVIWIRISKSHVAPGHRPCLLGLQNKIAAYISLHFTLCHYFHFILKFLYSCFLIIIFFFDALQLCCRTSLARLSSVRPL